MKDFTPPHYIVWSTDRLDLDDPFQRRWYLRQVLLHGRAEDIARLDLDEITREIDTLTLPDDIARLWRSFLQRYADR
jgi:hypothetical protein